MMAVRPWHSRRTGVQFNEVPNWQKRGVGVYWQEGGFDAVNPVSGARVRAHRQQLKVDFDLPMRDAYSDFIERLLPAE